MPAYVIAIARVWTRTRSEKKNIFAVRRKMAAKHSFAMLHFATSVAFYFDVIFHVFINKIILHFLILALGNSNGNATHLRVCACAFDGVSSC